MIALLILGLVFGLTSLLLASYWRWVAFAVGVYFLSGSAGILFYRKVGKLQLAERLLDKLSWRGDERVLDAGCGRGLLTVAAARRVPNGSVVGLDVWNPGALSGNRAESVLENFGPRECWLKGRSKTR
jgi:hypothetical protein